MTARNYKTYRYPIDREEAWGKGEWLEENDKYQWIDFKTGLDCLIVRHPSMGHLCGYVGVPPSHPAHGKYYSDVEVETYGGLTYADKCRKPEAPMDAECWGACHVPERGRTDHVWWLGFDCAHGGDLSPSIHKQRQPGGCLHELEMKYTTSNFHLRDTYKNVAFVRSEILRLANQLSAMMKEERN